MFPPAVANPATNPIAASGGIYSSPIGTPIDVPVNDVPRLLGNGWSCLTRGGGHGSIEWGLVGTTAQRPTGKLGSNLPLDAGAQYIDTTIGKIIVWDGATWRDYTGSAV